MQNGYCYIIMFDKKKTEQECRTTHATHKTLHLLVRLLKPFPNRKLDRWHRRTTSCSTLFSSNILLSEFTAIMYCNVWDGRAWVCRCLCVCACMYACVPVCTATYTHKHTHTQMKHSCMADETKLKLMTLVSENART